jgi:D-aminopeptidase
MKSSLIALAILVFLALPVHAERARARSLGVEIGTLPTGELNAITDVNGVAVGHVTLIKGEGDLKVGEGPVRTGVTAILPHTDDIYLNQVYAAGEILNGNGEMTGLAWVNERGLLEVPIVLTNTLSIGDAYAGVVDYMVGLGSRRVPLPVVAECYDGGLNDIAGRHVKPAHAVEAIKTASSGTVQEGSVGAGTGMRAYGFKAGIGTSSRIIPEDDGGYTVGVLVNANCGRTPMLIVDGVPVGRDLAANPEPGKDGSIIIVIATDAPLLPHQLRRLCIRSAFGVTRTGTVSRTSSGDFALAFSTAHRFNRGRSRGSDAFHPTIDRVETLADSHLTSLFQAVIEATEEAVINAMFASEAMTGRDGHHIPALPVHRVLESLQTAGRIK